jgi:tRNA modification GTPase
MTCVSVLTPPGTGAIATVEVCGPRSWELARHLFRPANKKPLPEQPELHHFWFGTLAGGDEVVLAVKRVEPDPRVEVHCHGGRRVVRWVVDQFAARGVAAVPAATPQAAELLARAPTLRTASILLDQYHGAFDRAATGILAHLERGEDETATRALAELARFAPLGPHLIEPWKVVIAGPPNVGKSSLVNALAGFHRSVVSDVAGTTRDVVTVPVAFDGWPVELTDTAGLRDSSGLEAEGIERAKRVLGSADLVVWLIDGTAPKTVWPEWGTDFPKDRTTLLVQTKSDLPTHPGQESAVHDTLPVSAVTGHGIAALAGAIVGTLVRHAPPPGAAVPYTPELADIVLIAHAALSEGRRDDAAKLFRDAIALT